MADNDTAQERTEKPTTKRLQEAKDKGEVARSKDLTTAIVMMAASVTVLILGPQFTNSWIVVLQRAFSYSREQIYNPNTMPIVFSNTLADALTIVWPLFMVTAIAAFVGSVILGGVSFSTKVFEPKISKLNPLTGIKKMFSLRSLIELVKTLAKFLTIAAVVANVLLFQSDNILLLAKQNLMIGLSHLGLILSWSLVAYSASLFLIAIVDAPYQLWEHQRKLKMTKQQIRDELKDTEGKPEVKSHIRQMQRELAQRRMLDEIPKADVVVTNPTHFAVALIYNSEAKAPRVVAKGCDDVAAKIREVAKQYNVPIFTAPTLARALYSSTRINQQIPGGLFIAVAQVLAYIYQLKNAAEPSHVSVPEQLPVPIEFLDSDITDDD